MRPVRTAILFLAVAVAAQTFAHSIDAEQHAAVQTKVSPPAIERLVGTIEALVVEDRVGQATYRYPRLRLGDGSLVPLSGVAIESLSAGTAVELFGSRNGVAFEVETLVKRSDAASTLDIQTPVQVEGELRIAHADDFARGRSRYYYEVHDDAGNVTRLELAGMPATLRGGMRIRIVGRRASDGVRLIPDQITILAVPDTKRSNELIPEKAATVNTVLVILATFSNSPAPAFSTAAAQAVMTSNSNSVANFYNEVSFGQQALNVTVTNWVTMNLSSPSQCDDTDLQGIDTAATSAATAANSGWNAANFGFVVYLFPEVPACGWNGLAYIGSPHKAYINGTDSFVTQVVTHEMGHNFGLLHAGSLDCGALSIGGACVASEYGDPFDTMANQRSMHFNAQQKRKLNWISAATVSTHSAGSVTYSLSPIESPGGSVYAIKIPTASPNRTYWLEFRQPIGFDSPLAAFPSNGAQIRVADPFETLCAGCDSFSNDTELLDMTPATSTFTDAALLAGHSFSDSTYGIDISVLSATSTTLMVHVSTAQIATTTTLTSSLNPSTVGASVTFGAAVNGTGPTGSVNFTDNGSTIAGCASVALVGAGNVRSASCTTAGLGEGTHSIVASYGGDTANSASISPALVQSVSSNSWLGYLSGGNQASGSGSAVAAGSYNVASGQGAFVGAGTSNEAAGTSSLVVGGFDNHAMAIDSLVGAGAGNRATGARSVVIGGGYNLASGQWSFIGGGGRESGTGAAGASTQDHIAAGKWSVIGGGMGNRAGALASQTGATVTGGEQNQALNSDATVGGGTLNVANAIASTISGGQSNSASGIASVVPGGANNLASGDYSFAVGRRAKAQSTGAFAFADSSNFDFNTTAANEFAARVTGGVRFVTAIDGTGTPIAGVSVAPGAGTWSSLSDRAAKQDLVSVDSQQVLAKLAAMPVYTWRYRSESSGALHMGPTAQDFHTAFGLGNSDKTITTVDADGVALTSIHALWRSVQQKNALITLQAQRLSQLRQRIAELESSQQNSALLQAMLVEVLNATPRPSPAIRPLDPLP
jgi:Bacterial Ig-like domain (group 3)/Gametolysin peptidase M11/Chaperone of endosialidase